tara:strand:- start:24117 stop:25799 length:1683 start_codon:yes stop_codon:yes gene_type:complete
MSYRDFKDFLPDAPDFRNEGLTDARNVVPSFKSYRPMKGISSVSTNALTERCQGFGSFRSSAGNITSFAGDRTKLYKYLSNTFTDVSGGATYSTGAENDWQFTQFGNYIIASNGANAPQVWQLDNATSFSNLGGSPPIFWHSAVVRNFLVTAWQPSNRNRIQWSEIGNHAGWTPGTNSADFETIFDTAEVTGLVGGEFGIIFGLRKIFQLNFVGGSSIFQIRTIEQERGCIAHGSLVTVGNTTYFLSQDGFASTDGETTKLIGENRIDDFFDGNLDQSNILRITSGHDPLNKLIFWSYPSTNSSGGNPDRILCYNYSADRWSYIDIPTQFVGSAFTTGTTLELLDNISTNVDTGFTDSFDSRIWQGGTLFFSAFDSTNKFATFSGNSLEATISVGEQEYSEGKRTFVSSINPVIDVQPVVKTGKISISSTTVNGTGTQFLSELSVGDVIRVADVSSQFNNSKFIVATIVSDTLLSIVVAPDQTINNVNFTGYQPTQINLVSRERAGGTTIETGFSACNDNGVATFRQSGKYHKVEVKVPANAVWSDAMGLEIEATIDGVQ